MELEWEDIGARKVRCDEAVFEEEEKKRESEFG